MNKIHVIVGGALLVLSTRQAYTKTSMPRLDRLRKKVDSALEGGGEHSLKDLLERAKKRAEKSGKPIDHNKLTLMALNATSSERKGSLEKKYDRIAKTLSEFMWAEDRSFIDQLTQTLDRDSNEALLLLKGKLNEHYAQENVPLVTFIAALKHEEKALNECSTSTFKLMSHTKRSVSNVNVALVQATLDEIMAYKNNLQLLMQSVERLLLGGQ